MIPFTTSQVVRDELETALNVHDENHAECIRALTQIYFKKRQDPLSEKDITRLMLAIEMQATSMLVKGIK